MPIGILFWFLMILWLLNSFVIWTGREWPFGPHASNLLLFLLFGLLGWEVFGPALKG